MEGGTRSEGHREGEGVYVVGGRVFGHTTPKIAPLGGTRISDRQCCHRGPTRTREEWRAREAKGQYEKFSTILSTLEVTGELGDNDLGASSQALSINIVGRLELPRPPSSDHSPLGSDAYHIFIVGFTFSLPP